MLFEILDEDIVEQKEERVPNAKIKQSVPKAAKLIDIGIGLPIPRPPVKSTRIRLAVKENRPSIISRPKVHKFY